MTVSEVLKHIADFRTAHEDRIPERAYVSLATAAMMAPMNYDLPERGHFAHQVLSAEDWFIDPQLSSDDIRLEGR